MAESIPWVVAAFDKASDDSRMKPILIAISVVLVLAFAPGQSYAADTYVSPSGTGTACTQAAPCSILTGGSEADADSAIILAPGNYGSPSDPIDDRIYTTAPNASYVGRPDATLYIDSVSTVSSITMYSGQSFLGQGTRIVSSDDVGVTVYGSAHIDRLNVRTTQPGGVACLFANEGMVSGGEIVNSLCVADGFGSAGIYLKATRNEESVQVLGTTAISLGNGGVGIGVENTGAGGGGTGYSEVAVYLSIASAPYGYDLEAGFDTDGNDACLRTYDSAATSIRPNGCGVSEDNPLRGGPGFAPGDPDFHLDATSPLVNTLGSLSYSIPEVDLEGRSRNIANPEPGAYEFPDPTPPKTCRVPRLRGLKLAQARKLLRRANCSPGRVTRKKVSRRNKVGRVLRQSPRAGSEFKSGTKVRITIGRRASSRG